METEEYYVHGWNVGYDLFYGHVPVDGVNYAARLTMLTWTIRPRTQAELKSYYNGVRDGYGQAKDDSPKT